MKTQTILKLDRYLLGDNPFIGVDHLSQERARERQTRLNASNIYRVVTAAIASGAGGLLFTTHPMMYTVLRDMRKQDKGTKLGLYPILPYPQALVRIGTEKGIVGLTRHFLGSLSWKARAKALVSGGLSLGYVDPQRALRAYVDTELEILSRNAPEQAILKSVLLHEVITDLLTSFEASELLRSYADHIRDKHGVAPGFATRNFTRFIDFAMKIGLPLDQLVVLAPFNRVGFQMNPSREACEQTLDQLPAANIIAMSILASGFLKLPDALQYLREHPKINSFVVGTSSEEHAIETFSELRRNLGEP